MAISHINGISVSGISHRNGVAKANISAINGVTAGFGGGGGGTITWQSKGTSAAGTGTTVSPTYPASIGAGDLLILYVHQKPTTSGGGTVSTPSGYSVLDVLRGTSQGSTSGADNGDTNVYAFYKEADGSETGTLAVTTSGQNTQTAVIHRLSKSAGTWSIASVTAEQTTSGNVSITFGSDPGVTSGDYILVNKVSPTEINTSTGYSSGAFSQSGITFGAVTQHSTNATVGAGGGMGTGNGNDLGGCVHGASVTAGTSSGNPQFTATVNGADHGIGPAMWVRIRLV